MQTSILDRNSQHARAVLNKLLGRIFFHSNSDLKVIKTRVLDLIVLLSRSTIEGGANVDQIFGLNNSYIHEIQKFQSLEGLPSANG